MVQVQTIQLSSEGKGEKNPKMRSGPETQVQKRSGHAQTDGEAQQGALRAA